MRNAKPVARCGARDRRHAAKCRRGNALRPSGRVGARLAHPVQYLAAAAPSPHSSATERQVIPNHTIAFSQQKLRSALRRSAQQESGLAYGFVIHARRRGTRAALGVITLGGESLVLTSGLIAGLAGRPLKLFGSAPISLVQGSAVSGAAETSDGRGDLPLASVMMQVEGMTDPAAAQQRVEVEAKVIADSLVQPLVVLTTARPASWPA